MNFVVSEIKNVASFFNSDIKKGLGDDFIIKNREKFGENIISKNKKVSLINKIISALLEPMMIILLFSFIIAFGSSFGQYLKTGELDIIESVGILFSVFLSVFITIIMENSSEKAFSSLNKMYENILVKVIRNDKITFIPQKEIVCGDVVFLESGDKVVADGRLIYSENLAIDESSLTGESMPAKKNQNYTPNNNSPMAERQNFVFSGTYVTSGNGKMIVTAVGNQTEIGNIAKELINKKENNSPLTLKLNKLTKSITITGVVISVLIFIVSLIKLYFQNAVNFYNIESLFMQSIIMIVAIVPEGLPTIVAVSLALNMIKLASQNALIKKMIATETAGAVSVICSDKTGTLTKNKMSVDSVCFSEFCNKDNFNLKEVLMQNFILNNTSDMEEKHGEEIYRGNGTECALISFVKKNNKGFNYKKYRDGFPVIDRIPFNSDIKFMETTVKVGEITRTLLKGAPEVVLTRCELSAEIKSGIQKKIGFFQKKSKRILCFAHSDGEKKFVYDGFCVLSDEIRSEVKEAIKNCKNAGIKIKMLTGDNYNTALSIANELNIADGEHQVINGVEIEKMTESELIKILPKITVIARSTPIVKLKIVNALKKTGEVVAVTGDGINDAPAIKNADIGFAMGKSGSEITKESADVVLLDDSFSTIVKTVSFGRNIYRNIQRFIVFQLSVNISAMLFICICSFLGQHPPFNTLELLWINIIMDGPPALTLGLNKINNDLMKYPPIKKDRSIISKNMLLRIIFNGTFISFIMILQYFYNFIKVPDTEKSGVIFTLFVLFQLANAFNCRELGSESILRGLKNNQIMALTFLITFVLQILLVSFFNDFFSVSKVSFISFVKVFFLSFSIIFITEIFKAVYRKLNKDK